MAAKYEDLIQKCIRMGAGDAKLLETSTVVFDPRSHLKCRFGCKRWGRFWTCPPNMNISQEAFMEGFDRYGTALMIQTATPEAGQDIALAVEKEAMLAHGAVFAFALALCVKCDECAYPEPCRYPEQARPTMDAYGIDIGRTVQALGFSVRFSEDGQLLPAWYSMVLLD